MQSEKFMCFYLSRREESLFDLAPNWRQAIGLEGDDDDDDDDLETLLHETNTPIRRQNQSSNIASVESVSSTLHNICVQVCVSVFVSVVFPNEDNLGAFVFFCCCKKTV